MLVWHCHEEVKHNGVRETLSEFRGRYWVTRKRFCRCRRCKLFNSRAYRYPKSPDLPKVRLRDDYPFSGTWVDYLGPLYSKNVFTVDLADNEDMHKSYVLLYTCASSRGVVLDLIPDTSSNHFLSFTRFISKRGCPKIMLSDNGGAFVADRTQSFAADRGIRWQFSIAEAPWYGGFWERLVQSVKRCLKKTVGTAFLTYVELEAVLAGIGLVLNSRPLGPMFDDLQDIYAEQFIVWPKARKKEHCWEFLRNCS